MHANFFRFCLALMLLSFLAACNAAQLEPEPTSALPPTVTRTKFVLVSPTSTAISSKTPLPSATLIPGETPPPGPLLGARQFLPVGYFSLTAPVMVYQQLAGDNQFALIDEENGVAMAFIGVAGQRLDQEPEVLMEKLLGMIFTGLEINHTVTPGQPKIVDGIESLTFDLTGTVNGFPSIGEAVLVMVNEKQVFFAYGSSQSDVNPNNWELRGAPVFDAVLSSVRLTQYNPDGSQCAQATDPTYGFTPRNPIRVGGGAEDGPRRESLYLGGLSGPNGEEVTDQSIGSEMVGDMVLDGYAVNIQGYPGIKTLYFDVSVYEEPKIPVGFTCAFPLLFGEEG
jgi:hypothetical protein